MNHSFNKQFLLCIAVLFTTLYSKDISTSKNTFSIGAGGYFDMASGYRHSLHLSYERVLKKGMLEIALRPSFIRYDEYAEYGENENPTTVVVNGQGITPQWTRDTYTNVYLEIGLLYSFRPYKEIETRKGRTLIMNVSRLGGIVGYRMYSASLMESDVGEFESTDNLEPDGFEIGIVYKPELGFQISEKFAMSLNLPIQLGYMPKEYYPRPGIGLHLNCKFFR